MSNLLEINTSEAKVLAKVTAEGDIVIFGTEDEFEQVIATSTDNKVKWFATLCNALRRVLKWEDENINL